MNVLSFLFFGTTAVRTATKIVGEMCVSKLFILAALKSYLQSQPKPNWEQQRRLLRACLVERRGKHVGFFFLFDGPPL